MEPAWDAGGRMSAGVHAKSVSETENVDRTQKEKQVAELRDIFSDAELVIVTHQSGLTVAESSTLRTQMREAGARFKVTKNRLAKIAAEGTPCAGLVDQFKGPTAIAYANEPVAAAKAALDFAKDNEKLVVLCGGLGGKVIDVDQLKALATLPSLDELRAGLLGLLQAPATKLAGVLQAPAQDMVGVLAAPARDVVGVLAAQGRK